MTMPRVEAFYERSGKKHYNTGRLRIPFRLMTSAGDWCEVEQGPKSLAGNVAGLCSLYSMQLKRRFEFRDMKNGTFRITVTDERVTPVNGR
jgi:hypothetical protein